MSAAPDVFPSAWRPIPSSPPDQKVKSLEDLIHERLTLEEEKLGKKLLPEIVKLEANYIRTAAQSSETVLYETSFHVEPRYVSFNAIGRDSGSSSEPTPQSVIYFLGTARTPLALPIVSNLSNALRGDEASYTVNLAVLPLPYVSGADTSQMHYYVIIERAIESNHSTNVVQIERYSKEFTSAALDPVVLSLQSTPPEHRAYIVKLEDGSVLDFYDDFARYFNEHILLKVDRLTYNLGRASISAVSGRLSIPYSVAKTSMVKVELLSPIDSAKTIVIIDSVKRPADYLAEIDMKPYPNGPYHYRMTALSPDGQRQYFRQEMPFEKRSPVIIDDGRRLSQADTLEVGGERVDAKALLEQMNFAYQVERAKTERLESTINQTTQERDDIRRLFDANRRSSIAGLRIRSGLGTGTSAGTNGFLGIEALDPMVALDISFGYLYSSSVPFIAYSQPQNISRIFASPKSLGLHLSYVPITFFGGAIGPLVEVGYYGIWSNVSSSSIPPGSSTQRSATLLSPSVGIAIEPLPSNRDVGVSFTVGRAFGLGLGRPAVSETSAKFYVRF